MNVQMFFLNYGAIIAGFFAGIGVIIGMISTYYSNQAAHDANEKLARSVKVIERLETVIGDQWKQLDIDQIATLSEAASSIPVKGRLHVMYLTSLGKKLAMSITTAFRAAKWDVVLSTGGGFESGVEVGSGPEAKAVLDALSTVIEKPLLVQKNPDQHNNPPYFFIGIGSKPVINEHKPQGG